MNLLKKIIAFVMDILETVVFLGSFYIVVYIYLFMPTSVNGASMEPALHNGDRLIVDKIAYKLKPLERGDIIVIKSPMNPDVDFVKRLIGLPNDIITINDGNVLINGIQLPEGFTSDQTSAWQEGVIKENIPFTIPEDQVVVMGDNRPHSFDSREFGSIPVSSIVGQVTFRYYPLNQSGLLENPLPKDLR